jgi:hypothetical protein
VKNSYINEQEGFVFLIIPGCFILAIIAIAGIGFMALGPGLGGGSSSGSNWTGSSEAVATLGDLTMPATEGKLGHEDHFFTKNETDIFSRESPAGWVVGDPKSSDCIDNKTHHVEDKSYTRGDEKLVSAGGCGAFGSGMKTDQERWYFNMRWDYGSNKDKYHHAKIIITNPRNNKKIVVSIEEYGPAEYVTTRDGINAGATPEVYKYLCEDEGSPYSNDPSDDNCRVNFGFAKDQEIPLGPLGGGGGAG